VKQLGKLAYGPPDVKLSPSLIDTSNTRGIADALPTLKEFIKKKLEGTHVVTKRENLRWKLIL